ncbi:MAG TPA: hypothetical protein VK422_00690 [Pyrinomonadaceae bacterium]|nr:hypothetical protein [Pyrinomonadaceae bacterium]
MRSTSFQMRRAFTLPFIEAAAVSGHDLLRPAAEEAARKVKLSPTLLCGRPVKVSGIITYNFVLLR